MPATTLAMVTLVVVGLVVVVGWVVVVGLVVVVGWVVVVGVLIVYRERHVAKTTSLGVYARAEGVWTRNLTL